MVSITFFKIICSHPDVMFNFSVISRCDFSLINKAAFQAMLSEWAFIRFSAVTFLFKYGSGCCVRSVCSVCCLRENAVVVFRNGAFYIFHAGVTHFDCIAVEDLVEPARFRKMLVNEL